MFQFLLGFLLLFFRDRLVLALVWTRKSLLVNPNLASLLVEDLNLVVGPNNLKARKDGSSGLLSCRESRGKTNQRRTLRRRERVHATPINRIYHQPDIPSTGYTINRIYHQPDIPSTGYTDMSL